MKKYISLLLIVLIFSCNKTKNKTTEYPHLPKNESQQVVLDLSHVFTLEESNLLAKKLIDYETLTTNQIVIITIDSITPYNNIQKYASDIGNFWGVGQKENDNGLVIAFSKNLHKVGISTGYGTELIITDSISKSIIDNTMIPLFKNGDYYSGINTSLDSIIAKWNTKKVD